MRNKAYYLTRYNAQMARAEESEKAGLPNMAEMHRALAAISLKRANEAKD